MSNITKHKHGPIDTFKYRDLPVIQMWGVDKAFNELFTYSHDYPFETIIELGADYGGLTAMIADLALLSTSNKAKIHTFDLNVDRFTQLNPKVVEFHHLDIYSHVEFIVSLFKGRTLLLCDGGNKKKEWELFSPALRSGDVIMAHDYFADEQAFKEGKEIGRWNWWEFDDDSITSEQDLFKPLDCFEQYCWCIREKK